MAEMVMVQPFKMGILSTMLAAVVEPATLLAVVRVVKEAEVTATPEHLVPVQTVPSAPVVEEVVV
jgi:hypothetical protein